MTKKTACKRSRAAFTLVELLVVIGVLAILVGVLLPTLRQTSYNAKATRSATVLQQNAHLLVLYARDWKDVYPIASPNASTSGHRYYEALVSAGLLPTSKAADPDGFSKLDECSFIMSFALVFDPALMVRGNTVPVENMTSVRVRLDQVVFPASKGVISQFIVWYANEEPSLWAGGKPYPAPVQFADGSGIIATWQQFKCERGTSGGIYLENVIGVPVISTWTGYQGQDR